MNLLYSTTPTKPRVRFYEGVEGVKAIFEDTLTSQPKEIVDFTSIDDLVNVFGAYMKSYTKRRAALRIPLRAIVADTPLARRYNTEYYRDADPAAIPDIRFVPEHAGAFKVEMNIYGNKVAIFSQAKDLITVIIESEAIVESERNKFDLLWNLVGTMK